jgi:carbamoyltransferase
MIILGYNGLSDSAEFFAKYGGKKGRDKHRNAGHDAAAAVFKDGVLIAAAEE